MKKQILLPAGFIMMLAFSAITQAQTGKLNSKKIVFIPFDINNAGKVTFNVNDTFFSSLNAELARYGSRAIVPEEHYIDSLAEKLNIDMVDQDNAATLAKALGADVMIFGQVWEFNTDAGGNTVVNANIYMIDGRNGSIISTIKYLPGNFYFGLRDKTPFSVVENLGESLVQTLRMWKYI